LLQESWLTRPEFSLWVEVLVGLSAGLLVIIVIPMCSPVRAVLIVVALTGALLAASSVALVRASVLIDALPPVLYLAAAAISLGVLQWVASERSRRTLGLALATERLQRARLDGELDAARNIQQGFLPDASRFDMPPGCSLAAYLEPAAEVGGDLYDIARLEDGRLFIVLGDVSGKGVAASLFMAVSKTLCKSIALRGSLGADEILTLANSEISRENPELLFVTAVVALVNTTTGEIEVANAGHDAPVVIRPGRTPRRLSVAGGPPLCALDDFTYSSVFERLEAGETLVLTTDGVSEAINPEGEFFGYDGLSAALTQVHDDADATAITQHIRTTLTDFARGAPPNDDIAVLTFHYG
jgi:adenylate cyclase